LKEKEHNITISVLRIFAFLSVLCFHLQIPNFKNGFVGVDIFFVISGFIISKILLFENFDLKSFYQKRFIRIVLSYLLIIFVISFISIFTNPKIINSLAESIISLFLFIYNFHLSFQNNYFDLNNYFNPLIHLWTISVEIQFYLIFPLIFLLKKKHQGIVIFIIFILSLLLFFFLDNFYYSTPARFYEFLFGYYAATINLNFKNNIILKIFKFALIVIFVLNLFLHLDARYHILIQSVTTGLILSVYNLKKFKNIFSGIKNIAPYTYELYLLHWPIIVFASFLNFELPSEFSLVTTSLILLVLLFSTYIIYLLKFFLKNKKNNFILCLFLSLIIISSYFFSPTSNLIVNLNKKFLDMNISILNLNTNSENFLKSKNDTLSNYAKNAGSGWGIFENKFRLIVNCESYHSFWCSTYTNVESLKKTDNIGFFGDSKIYYISTWFIANLKNKFITTARPSCFPIYGFYIKTTDSNLNECIKMYIDISNNRNNNYDLSIISFSYKTLEHFYNLDLYYDNKFENQIPKDKKFIILNNSFREFVKIVKSKSNKILLIADNPRLLETEFCLRSNLIDYRKIKFNGDFCAISKESYLYQNNMITKIYEENLNLLNLSYVSPNQIYKLFCEEYCSIKKNEKFLYVIRDHLNDNSSKILMEYILNNFKINYEYNKL